MDGWIFFGDLEAREREGVFWWDVVFEVFDVVCFAMLRGGGAVRFGA